MSWGVQCAPAKASSIPRRAKNMWSPGKRLKLRESKKRASKNHDFQAGEESLKRIKYISLPPPVKY